MDNRLTAYIAELEKLLRGRVPGEELRSILTETSSHLSDLRDEYSDNADPFGAALKKFGPAKRFARRLLLSRETIPSPWRAAIWPLGLALAYSLFQMLMPSSWLTALVTRGPVNEQFLWFAAAGWIALGCVCLARKALLWKPIAWMAAATVAAILVCGPNDGLYIVAVGTWLAVMVLFYRARQILWVPLLGVTAGFFLVAALTGPLFHFVAVMPDGSTQVINRVMARAMAEQEKSEIALLKETTERLDRGQALFARGKAESLPAEYRFDQGFQTPSTIANLARWDGATEAQSGIPLPFFVTMNKWVGPEPATWSQAVRAWKDTAPYLQRIQHEQAKREALLAAMPQAERTGYWLTAARLAAPWFSLVARTGLILLEMNILAWLLWQISRRLTWPSRRWA